VTFTDTADRLEVEELVSRYTWAIDGKEWDSLRDIFMSDATADYRELGGTTALLNGVDEIVSWLRDNLDWREDSIPWHFVSNHLIDVDGDQASSRHYMHNRHLTVVGRYFIDSTRTSAGWRITSLTLRATTRNAPLPEAPLARPSAVE
jgi:hypothetical protein